MCKSVFTWCLEDQGVRWAAAWRALNDAGECAKGWNLEICLPLNGILP